MANNYNHVKLDKVLNFLSARYLWGKTMPLTLSDQLQGPLLPGKETIFSTMSALALSHQAINLGQGHPDFPPPEVLTQSLITASNEKIKTMQYAPAQGSLGLREILCHTQKKYYGLEYNPSSEIIICNGATGVLFNTLLALCSPGDEVIVFNPAYDSYNAAITLAKAVVKPVYLHSPDFRWDSLELAQAFSSKTKAVIINSPHNPSGRIFTKEELNELCQLIKKHNCWAISDEVYEHMVYDQNQHIPLACLEGMKERTISVGSAGKTFGATGLKVGWAMGPARVISAILTLQQYNSFCVATPMQRAVELAFAQINEVTTELRSTYQKKRDIFIQGLKKLGLSPLIPEGGYFIVVPLTNGQNDLDYCINLVKKAKVVAIPVSLFDISSANKDSSKVQRNMLRFCFAKEEKTLQMALEALALAL